MVKPIRLRNAEILAQARATLIRAGRGDELKRAHNARVMREARSTVKRANQERAGMPPELRALMERYCQLGRLLPPADNDWTEDPRAMAEVGVVLREMDSVKAQIDEFLAAARSMS